jgi:hypothetical protein
MQFRHIEPLAQESAEETILCANSVDNGPNPPVLKPQISATVASLGAVAAARTTTTVAPA